MFTIIGADQKQYGPVSADDIRQWVREGRADGRTLALREGENEWKPLAAFADFAEALAGAPTPRVPPFTGARENFSPEQLLARDYDLDIMGCISRAWKLVSKNLGLAVGVTVLVMLSQFLVNQLVSLIFIPWVKPPAFDPNVSFQALWKEQFTTPHIVVMVLTSLIVGPFQAVFIAGLYRFYLKLIRGEPAGIADAFSGFSDRFVQLLIAGFILNLCIILGTVLFVIPGIYLSIALIYAFPLVLDKGLNWSEAMKLSLKMVNKHWFVVLGLFFVAGLVGALGLLACCVGILFTLPLCLAAMAYGYEEIFGRQSR